MQNDIVLVDEGGGGDKIDDGTARDGVQGGDCDQGVKGGMRNGHGDVQDGVNNEQGGEG